VQRGYFAVDVVEQQLKGWGGKKGSGDEHRKRDEEIEGVEELLVEHGGGGVAPHATVPSKRGHERYRVGKKQDECCETQCETEGS